MFHEVISAFLGNRVCRPGVVLGCQASVIYSYVAGSPTYTAPAGNTITVPIYLQETITGSSSSLINADGGLFGAGFSVNRASGSTASLTAIADAVSTNFVGGFSTPASGNGAARGACRELRTNRHHRNKC